MSRLRMSGILVSMCAVALGAAPGRSQPVTAGAPQPGPEYLVKAAYLLNFTKFVDWPGEAFGESRSGFVLCLVGGDPFGPAIDRMMAGETVNGRAIVVRRMEMADSSCHLAFFAGPGGRAEAAGRYLLTVGEGAGFLREGGAIAMVLENRRVRFDVSRKAAAAAGLKVSSRLLSVARNVE
ncbi:MAG: YfiR family protein [Bryobacteraceae bacterium]|nr:YfiR family protein [Bryobacteraceae bacterium]